MAECKHILVTGSTGAIGREACRELAARGHKVRGFARRPTRGVDDVRQGDLGDFDAVRDAVAGVDTVVHLGAFPEEADFLTKLLQPNIVGVYHICEAAREHGVRRLILASSGEVVFMHPWKNTRTVRVEDGVAPRGYYAATKVFAEAVGQICARNYGFSVIAVRLGWLPRTPEETARIVNTPQQQCNYLSPADAGRFFAAAVESPNPGPSEFALVFATSKPRGHVPFDLEPARKILGYEPQDTWPDGAPYLNELS